MNWSLLETFSAVAQHGSLSAAAKATKRSQPTLSRHISILEQQLGYRVFERSKAGVTLTSGGLDLLEHTQTMADAAAKLSMVREGRAQDLNGTVRITASQIMATYILPDLLVPLHAAHPELAIEVVASDETNNLSRREADIALRMYRPTQNDMITQHVGDMPIAAYGAHSYLERHGAFKTVDDLMTCDLIGYDRSTLIIDGLRAHGFKVIRDSFKFRSDDQVVCWQMVRAGFGVGFNQMTIGDADDTVINLSGPAPVASIPVWLTAHPELRHTPRIRRVFDHLRDGLRQLAKGV